LSPITRIDRIEVGVADCAASGRAWSRFLGLEPVEDSAHAIRFQLFNAALQLVDARRDASDSPEAPTPMTLCFAAEPELPSITESRGVSLSVEVDAAPPALSQGQPAAPPDARVLALDHIVVRSDDLDASKGVYGEQLGLRLALDREFPKRRVRLVFFRVGGVTVELGGSLVPEAHPGGPDLLWGLAWRVVSIEAAHRRLAADGFRIASIRAGHKDGTRVFGVSDPPSRVPTLVLEDPSRGDATRLSA